MTDIMTGSWGRISFQNSPSRRHCLSSSKAEQNPSLPFPRISEVFSYRCGIGRSYPHSSGFNEGKAVLTQPANLNLSSSSQYSGCENKLAEQCKILLAHSGLSVYRTWRQDDFFLTYGQLRFKLKPQIWALRPWRASQPTRQGLCSPASCLDGLQTAQCLHTFCREVSSRGFSRSALLSLSCKAVRQRKHTIPSPRDEKERLPHVNTEHTEKWRTTQQTHSLPWATSAGHGWCLQIPLNLGGSPLI